MACIYTGIRLRKRILLIAATTGYQTRTLAAAAERAGYDIRLATDRCHELDNPWGDQAIALRFQHPEIAAEVIASEAGAVDGLVAVGDRPAHIAALAGEMLGLPHNPPDAVLACRNKYLARERFRAAGLPVPVFRRIRLEADAAQVAREVAYPCVLKPLGLSGSRGVIRADSTADFEAAFERIRRILALPDIARMQEEQDRYIQVEAFIPGREFALEGILSHGRLTVLALFDKPDPLDGPFFEETMYVTPSRASAAIRQAIVDASGRSVAALGLVQGPVHAEMRVNDEGVWMLEVAARPIGGLCAQVLRFSDGGSLEELIVRHAAGDPMGSTSLSDPARGVMMIPIPREGIYTRTQGLEDARMVEGIEEIVITAKEGQRLVPLPEGASYLGFIFAKDDTPAGVEAALREAHARLTFETAQVLPIVR